MELAPPESLAAPESIKPVERDQADGMVKLKEQQLTKLDQRATEFVESVVQAGVNSEDFKKRINAIHNMGSKEIRQSAQVSNRMLDKPTKSLQDNIFDDQSPISRALMDLRRTVEDLDPSKHGDLLSTKKLFGLIPFGNKLRDYFRKFESSQSHINAILNTLQRSQDELRKDNAALEQEKVNLWQVMERLQEYIYIGKQIDQVLEARIHTIEIQDPEKARVVKEEMLFYVRQKVQDLLTQLAVSIQGYLALDMVRKNNLELIKGVERASTTTISALRTAVIVAQALANQKLVLDQINALNKTTGDLIEGTSAMLKQQSGQIHQQAASATIDIEQLQRAFDNIYETMDMVSNYKLEALDTMQQSVNVLTEEVNKASTYLDRVRREEVAQATGDLNLLEADDDLL